MDRVGLWTGLADGDGELRGIGIWVGSLADDLDWGDFASEFLVEGEFLCRTRSCVGVREVKKVGVREVPPDTKDVVTGAVDFPSVREEGAEFEVGAGQGRREEEGGFGEVELAGNELHLGVGEVLSSGVDDRQGVALVGRGREDVDD